VTKMTTTVNNQTSIEGGKLKEPLFTLNSTNGSPARLTLANQATNQARINMEDGTNIVNFTNTKAKSPKINGSDGNETIRIKDGSQITGKAKIKLGGDSDTIVIDGIINNATINNGNDDSKDKLKISSSGVIEGKGKVKNFGREDRLNIDGETFKYNALQDKDLQKELKEIGIAVNLMESN